MGWFRQVRDKYSPSGKLITAMLALVWAVPGVCSESVSGVLSGDTKAEKSAQARSSKWCGTVFHCLPRSCTGISKDAIGVGMIWSTYESACGEQHVVAL